MRGFDPEVARRIKSYANGGVVRGPGTGTSDDVQATIAKGSYIMPADSTKKLGADALGELGRPVPVNLSNGEYQMPPEQVHAVGVQALNQIKDATHAPVKSARGFAPEGWNPPAPPLPEGAPRGFDPESRPVPVAGGARGFNPKAAKAVEPRMFFAGGGSPAEEELKRAEQKAAAAQVGSTTGATTASAPTQPANTGGSWGSPAQPQSTATQPTPPSRSARGFAPASVADARFDLNAKTTTAPAPNQGVMTYGANYGAAGYNPATRTPAAAAAAAPAAPVKRSEELTAQLQGMPAPQFQRDIAQRQALEGKIQRAQMNERYDSAGAQMAAEARAAATMRMNRAANRPLAAASLPASTGEAALAAYDAGGAGAGRGFVNPPLVSPPTTAPVSAATAAPATAPSGPGPSIDRIAPAGDATAPTAAIATPPAAPAGSTPPSNQVMPGVYQHGRGQYSDSADGMGFSRGFTGVPSAANQAAADALAARSAADVQGMVARGLPGWTPPASVQAPQVQHSGNSWQARNDLRNAAVSASSMTEQPGYGGILTRRGFVGGVQGATPAQQAYQSMLASDQAARAAQNTGEQTAMRENAAIQRTGMQEQGATGRNAMDNSVRTAEVLARGFDARRKQALDERRLGLEERAQQPQIQAAQRQEALFQRYQAAKTPEERNAIAQQIRDLKGTASPASWKAVALQGGTDAMGNKTEGVLAAVNEQTGEVRRLDSVQGGAKEAAPTEVGQRKAGTVYSLPNGKLGRWTSQGWELVD